MSPRKRPTNDGTALDHFATGSGIDARMNAIGPTGEDVDRVVLIPLTDLVASASQPRTPIHPKSVATLAEQIRVLTLLSPILVRPVFSEDGTTTGCYQILAGHRRVEAYRILATEDTAYRSIPALIKMFDNVESAVATQVENLGRLELSPWETARGIESLRRVLDAAGLPCTIDAIRGRLGESAGANNVAGGNGANAARKRKAPSRGGVSQHLKIGAVVTVDLLRAAGVTVSGEETGDIDYDLVNGMKHASLMRIAQAPDGDRVDVLREVAAALRAPAKRRARGAKLPDAVDVVTSTAPAPSGAADVVLVANEIDELGSVTAIKRLDPDAAQHLLDTLWPKIAALAEVAGKGQMVVAGNAGSGLVAFIRSADPSTRSGQFILQTLGERMSARHAEMNAPTARTNAVAKSTASSRMP